jgi:hypothetical protein
MVIHHQAYFDKISSKHQITKPPPAKPPATAPSPATFFVFDQIKPENTKKHKSNLIIDSNASKIDFNAQKIDSNALKI